MAQHTPGPWRLDPCTWGGRRRIAGNHTAIAEVVDDLKGLGNARLIAAAPEMLEALTKAEVELSAYSCDQELVDLVRGAIAKAEGRS